MYIGGSMIRMKLDVETLRVIYFTENPDEILHYSPYTVDYDHMGQLPLGMSLNNCWNWTLKGNKFVNTEETVVQNNSLFENNKLEVKKLLIKRINYIRMPYLSECVGGDYLRLLKLESSHEDDSFFITELARAANLTKEEYKVFILSKKQEYDKILETTEINKIYYLRLINEAPSDYHLFLVRDEFANIDLTKIQVK